ILLARELGLGQDSVTELFRRAVFNVIGRNQDDHTKNFGFLMDKTGEWRLSPAFDMTYAFDPTGKWTKMHQIRLNRKQDGFTRNDLLDFGRYCNLGQKKADSIISVSLDAFSTFSAFAEEYDVKPELTRTIQDNLRTNL
ncbi:MAG: HipA domain-containing protein, partial [SAR324 cluster bacterium]|nr:HipA domain-containing protein [SAR324 cluster bacterium]